MAVRIEGTLNGLDVNLVHGPSGSKILTTPPVDNGGTGSTFSPTDLFSASYGACVLTIMALKAKALGVKLPGARFVVEKIMTPNPPRKVQVLKARFEIQFQGEETVFQQLVAAGKACPVRLSIGDSTPIEEEFVRI